METLLYENNAAVKMVGNSPQILRSQGEMSNRSVNQRPQRGGTVGLRVKSSNVSDWSKPSERSTGAELVHLTVLSEIFGDFENIVDVVGEDCGEVGSWASGHVGAKGNFTNVLGILNVPDLWHAAPGPEQRERKTRLMRMTHYLSCNWSQFRFLKWLYIIYIHNHVLKCRHEWLPSNTEQRVPWFNHTETLFSAPVKEALLCL